MAVKNITMKQKTASGYDELHPATTVEQVSGVVPPAKGGTGQTSLQATRNAMGLGNTTGALPVANGGTGANNTATARANLGLKALATKDKAEISDGGTGATTASQARANLGLGTVATENVVPVAKGGTGANNDAQARANLGLGSLATKSKAEIADGGTGETVRYSNDTIDNYDSVVLKSFNGVCRYYPYLKLVYLDINATTQRKIEVGEDISFGYVATPTNIPSGRRALAVSTTGTGMMTAFIDSTGAISMRCKANIASGQIISITGMYRV